MGLGVLAMIDLAALKTAAEKATPGPWSCNEEINKYEEFWVQYVETLTSDSVAWSIIVPAKNHRDSQAVSNAAFIAAADPATVAALITAVEAAQNVAAPHHAGMRVIANKHEHIPAYKLEQLRSSLAVFADRRET